MAETWKFNGLKSNVPQKTVTSSDDFRISGKSYLDDTFKENFTILYCSDTYQYLAFGSAGFWDGRTNEYGSANILVLDSPPTGTLLTFLQTYATKQLTLKQSVEQHITDAYTAIGNKSGTIPTNKNLANLAGAIGTISTGTDTSDGTIEPTTVLKGYKGYAKGVAVDGAIETYDGTVEDVGPAMRLIPVIKDETTHYSVISGLNKSKVYTVFWNTYNSFIEGVEPYSFIIKYENNQWTASYQYKIKNSTDNSVSFIVNTGDYFDSWTYGVVVEDDVEVSWAMVNGYVEDITQTFAYWLCLIEGTLITLANGTKKPIEQVTYDDDLLVWNFYEGKFDTAKPCWIKIPQVASEYNLCKFSNGAEVGFVGEGGNKGYHRIYNDEAKCFTHTGVAETPIGTTTFAEDISMPTLIEQEVVTKEVKYYNIITDKHYNLFANGILTSCRLSNKHAIENMKYVGEQLITDEEERAYFERIENIKA